MTASDDALDPTQRLNTRAGPATAPPDGDERILPGDRIGHFRIAAVLGSGGMGEVYRAEQLEPVRRTVALKRLRLRRLDARQLAWFEIERQVLAQMQHPAIAQIFDAGTDDDGAPYFAMEFIEGDSLLRYCELHRLTLRARLELLIRVCEGVQHAHQKGIIHRDLKPANILVSTVDGRALPRIIDFGIATATTRSLAAGSGSEIVGTPDYMSPEQAGVSAAAVDLRSDVYALGVILYELLTGLRPGGVGGHDAATTLRPPSRALDTLRERAAGVAQRQGLSLPSLRRNLRDDLDWIALKAIAPERDARYDSAAAFAADLRCYLDGYPVAAAPASRRYVLGKFVRRNRLGIATAGVALAALLAGLALSLYGLWQADAQRRVAEARGRELEQVVAFQQATLKGIDIAAMGTGLIAAQREQLATQLARDAQRDTVLAQFDAATQRIAPSDLARTALDRFVLAGALASIDRDFADQPQVAADLRASAAEVYMAIGGYARAAELWRAVLDARQTQLGPDALPTLQAESELGTALGESGDLAAARTILEGLYRRTTDRADLPLDLRERIAAAYAVTLNDQGETAAALQVQEALLARIVAERGERDLQALKVRNNLAISLVRAGRREEARDHFEAVLEVRRGLLPPDDPDLLGSMLNVAAIRGALDDFDGALDLQQQVYDTLRRLHGDEHPKTLGALNNLASTLSRMGRADEAIAQLERVVAVARRTQGATHPDTLRWINNLAATLVREGRFEQALPLQREAFEARARVLGPNHQDTLRSAGNVADLLGKLERYDEAIALARSNLAARTAVLGPMHQETIEAQLLLARLLSAGGDAQAAIDALRALLALDIGERDRVNAQSQLYAVYRDSGRTADAVRVRREAIDPFLARDPATLDPALRFLRERLVEDLADDDAAG
ncbi:serine/threonine-protein kinase [Chiayiivirga flava]|uniref:Non-specific serine/threonine protein kinase/serine/threonine-protein kinase n=1 Tax=Chiayiivirga flava TaxID=659595 RepID=A0A7W8D5C3_9GAMM|nr:serine/threonine-protein kinase [Chiayiivirga flava]MBB5206987.1 non-specific serine/threonine protein kinase/serine/threonine-protein kinase [Chiayiivirga flava]